MYFCVVLCIVCFVTFSVLFVCVYMCTELLPPGGYPIAFQYIISYHMNDIHDAVLSRKKLDVSTLTHCGRVTQICVFNTVKLGTSANSP